MTEDRSPEQVQALIAEMREYAGRKAVGAWGEYSPPVDAYQVSQWADRLAALARQQEAGEGRGETETLRKALTKIDAVRNSIIGTQTENWSAHVYPLVLALADAGYEGLGYDKARVEAETLIEQCDRLRTERDAALAVSGEGLGGQPDETMLANAWYRGRASCMDIDPATSTGPQLQERCRRDLAALKPHGDTGKRYLLDEIPAGLWREVREKAKREGVSIRALILGLLERWCASPSEKDDTR